MQTGSAKRRRLFCAFAFLAIIGLGLLVRSHHVSLPTLLAKYAGDALWAAMVYFAIGLCGPSLKSRSTALAALGFSFFIETTQLYHPPWLDQIRSARLGHLILGSTFNPPDFLAYLVGVLLAWIIDFGSRAGESRGEP